MSAILLAASLVLAEPGPPQAALENVPIVRCVLVLPPGGTPWPKAPERLDRVVRDLQWWYSCQMEAHGYGPKTFGFEADAAGKLVVHTARLTDDTDKKPEDKRGDIIAAAEAILGKPRQRKGNVMLMVYNGWLWTDRAKFQVEPLGSAVNGRWAFLNGWHFWAANRSGWRVWDRIPKLPLQNPYFSEEATRVYQSATRDGDRAVAERTSVGYGVFAHELGHSFGLHHPPRGTKKLPGDLMTGDQWNIVGNFLEDVTDRWTCLRSTDAAILDKNPMFVAKNVPAPSSGAARRIGMRGAVRR